MKQFLITVIMILSVVAQSQTIMRIHQSNGTVLQIPLNSIDSITYAIISIGELPTFNPALTYGSLNDIDGNTYKTIQIGSQTWMAENLRTTKYRNGTIIPQITDNIAWQNDINGGWNFYNNNSNNNYPYGKLYNWYAVANSNKICPEGWHIPTDNEWNILISGLDPSFTAVISGTQSDSAGGKLKSTGIQFWLNPNEDATNSTGFSGLPGGYRLFGGSFDHIGKLGFWWSATDYDSNYAWARFLHYNDGAVDRLGNSKPSGLSVRCLKD